jgi:hypothetical protein
VSHTPPPGTNPFAGQYILGHSNNSVTIPYTGPTKFDVERELGTTGETEVSIDLEQLSQFKSLQDEVYRLQDTVAAQSDQIKELYEIINSLRQNYSGQRGYQNVGYWQES